MSVYNILITRNLINKLVKENSGLTYVCGDSRPNDSQKRLYTQALEQIEHNMALLRPGVSFREFAEKSWVMPARYEKNRYMSLIHGAGLAGEYPYVPYAADFELKGYDGLFEAGMTVCVESYLGAEGDIQGVKLEQLVHITPTGPIALSDYPFDEDFF